MGLLTPLSQALDKATGEDRWLLKFFERQRQRAERERYGFTYQGSDRDGVKH